MQAAVRITLTAEQQALVRQASGKNIASLGIEPNETGSGWLYSAGNQFWLLKHSDPESYRAARRRLKPRIDLQRARFCLRIGKSRIHRFGVFAEERIPACRNVIDYIGEMVNPVESCRRNKNAKEKYVIKLDDFWRIDGAVGGSGAEFINHSCDPNIRYRVVRNRVVCQSIRTIAPGEELTADYRFSHKAPKLPCRCGSPNCRGTINFPKGSDQIIERKRTRESNKKKPSNAQAGGIVQNQVKTATGKRLMESNTDSGPTGSRVVPR